jgi:hypothetical protein
MADERNPASGGRGAREFVLPASSNDARFSPSISGIQVPRPRERDGNGEARILAAIFEWAGVLAGAPHLCIGSRDGVVRSRLGYDLSREDRIAEKVTGILALADRSHAENRAANDINALSTLRDRRGADES